MTIVVNGENTVVGNKKTEPYGVPFLLMGFASKKLRILLMNIMLQLIQLGKGNQKRDYFERKRKS